MNLYFFIGMFSTLSLNTFFSQVADNLFAGAVSLAGGILSAILVAWLKNRWHNNTPR